MKIKLLSIVLMALAVESANAQSINMPRMNMKHSLPM